MYLSLSLFVIIFLVRIMRIQSHTTVQAATRINILKYSKLRNMPKMYWLPLLLPQRHLVQNCSAALPLAAPTNEFIALMNSKSLLVLNNIFKISCRQG